MRKLLKHLSCLLSVILIVSALTACGGEEAVNTGSTFTYWVTMSSSASQSLTSYNELLMYQEMSKATGTNVEFIHPSAGSTGSEAFQILLSSGDYPDMIEYSWKSYAGGPDAAIADGVIIALNDYMKEYAPNYYEYVEGEKNDAQGGLYRANTVSSNGNFYGFSKLCIGSDRGFSGLFVRKDLLDKWGLDIPVTIDDWDELFAKAKSEGIERPFTSTTAFAGAFAGEIFNSAYEVGNACYIDDNGKFKFGPFQPEYKEYLKKMSEWVKKGYIDPDYITNTSVDVEGYICNGIAISGYGYIGSTLGKIIPAMQEKDPNFDLAACPYPVMKDGEKSWFQSLEDEAGDPTVAISTQCGATDENRYKEAMQWCDYLYTEEGMLLKSFGVEGDTYTVEEREDGKHYVYTDKILDHEKLGLHSVDAAIAHFFRGAAGPGFSEHPDYLDGYYPYPQQKDAIKVWNAYVDEAKKHTVPWSMTYSDEEAAEKAQIEAAGKDEFKAAISNIILGKAGIDSLDDAIAEAKKDGFDRLIEIYESAYNRYVSQKK